MVMCLATVTGNDLDITLVKSVFDQLLLTNNRLSHPCCKTFNSQYGYDKKNYK